MADSDPLADPLSEAWLTNGHDEHLPQALEASGPVLDLINRGLRLLAWLISAEREVAAHSAFPNDLGSLACFTQAFRQVRGAVTLCMFGYYNEARMLERGIYEASGLGRMIGHEASQSQRWIDGSWIPDRDVRQYMDEQTGSAGDSSEYQQFYRAACDYVHPRAISFVPYVFNVAGDVDPQLVPRFDSARLTGVLSEIALLCVFMCYAAKNAAVDEDAILPDWRESLDELAREVTGEPVGDLTRDWDRERREFERIHSYFRPAHEVEEFLDSHPNSRRNILWRTAAQKRHDDSASY